MNTFLRRMGVLLVLAALSLGYAVHTVRAELERSLFEASESMFALPPSWLHGAPRDVRLNGATVRVSSGRSELSLSALLDHAEAGCQRHDGGLAERLAAAPRRAGQTIPSGAGSVLRAENGREGMVACLDLGTSELTVDELMARLQRFARELDLAELGGVRLVRVRALAYGSFFVLAESQGPVPLARMFPDVGDAPGSDFASLPRPQHSRRLLSAWQPETEPGIAAYEAREAPDELWASYLGLLRERGWTPSTADVAQSTREHAALLSREGHSALIAVTRLGSASQVLLMPMDAGPGSVAVR